MIPRLLAVALALLTLGLAPGPAHAVTDEEVELYYEGVVRYDAVIDLAEDGTARVQLALDYNFGIFPRHGPYLTFTVLEPWDEHRYVATPITDVRVSSPTADATVTTSTLGETFRIRIGTEGRTFTGTHTYRVSFTVAGWIAGAEQVPGITEDELYRNLISSWDVPVENVTVRVTGPVAPTSVACFARRSTIACDRAGTAGATAVLGHGELPAGSALTVLVTYPAGTFDTAPDLVWRTGFVVSSTTLTLGVLAAGAGGALTVAATRRRPHERFADVPPGVIPAPGGAVRRRRGAVTRRRGAVPVAVRFTPPDGVTPGLIGPLLNRQSAVDDVSATLVDLAVRGYLRIVETSPPGTPARAKSWRFDRLPQQPDGLVPYERELLGNLFPGLRRTVTLAELADVLAPWVPDVRRALNEEAAGRGWYQEDPARARLRWAKVTKVLVFAALGLTAALWIWTPWGLVGVGLSVAAVVAMAVRSRAGGARTALGSALVAQAEGFRLYLETAEADRLRFEEGEDVFSRYLPFAIAFEVTDRWTRVFETVDARSRPAPTWYAGADPVRGSDQGIGRALTQLTSSTNAALRTSMATSSGSGGSSRGGSAGGGRGGGGGGSW